MRKIELLAPAKNLNTGIAAINFGADAVYIGPEKFSARAAAANTLKDIEKLITHAHIYNAKVYAAINTILYDSELEEAEKLITDLYNRGIDAVIIQDMGILEMNLPPVHLHASTQTDNYDLKRIKFLDSIGFPRIVLARELSLQQIKAIRKVTSCELEYFIHGALCVSLSGRCYMSTAIGGRSANRGECAQPCRKNYTLTDADGEIISNCRYPLSLKDMNQTPNLKELIDAGIDSLKIEGRLKDIEYVKNITAHYRKELDSILEGRNDISKASSGKVYFDFNPDPAKTFNRGYTQYFAKERTGSITSPHTPKSPGKEIGKVRETSGNWFTLSASEKISNGDGLAFFDRNMNLSGVKVNRVEKDKIFPLAMNGICKGAVVYRNRDVVFEKTLSSSRTERKIALTVKLSETETGFKLTLIDEDRNSASAESAALKEISNSDRTGNEQIRKQIAKLGGTIFSASEIKISLTENYFIPVSILNDLRRKAVENLIEARTESYKIIPMKIAETETPYPLKKIDFRHNVSNRLAEKFYRRHGVDMIEKSFETSDSNITGPLMTTKLCLKHENNLCHKQNIKSGEFKEPFYLIDGSTKYRIEFDCINCMMLIFKNQ
jgi:putative protease